MVSPGCKIVVLVVRVTTRHSSYAPSDEVFILSLYFRARICPSPPPLKEIRSNYESKLKKRGGGNVGKQNYFPTLGKMKKNDSMIG